MQTRKIRTRFVTISNCNAMQFRILGLDCSSNTMGWGLITLNENRPMLIAHGHIKPLDSKFDIFVRLQDVYEKIGDLCQIICPTHVVIEDIVFHMQGRSSAKTITTLAIFNRMAGTSVYTHTGIAPELFAVGTIRKLIRQVHPEADPKFKKEDIPDIIRTYLEPNFVNIINRSGNISSETYDESDGIAAAWAYSIQLGKNNE
jgi:Holliday junction resolvasome RuvABC endonuclease subunit